MELNKEHILQVEVEDRLSMLHDDILLSILERVDICTGAKTSVLSTRWRHLPWQLTKLDIDVAQFIHARASNGITTMHIDEAMSTLTKAARSLLAVPQRETSNTSLCLKLYLMGNYSSDIGLLLSEAIDGRTVKDLDLAILNEKEPEDCDDKDMLCQARVLKAFAGAFPRVLHCITRLSLYNVYLHGDIHHILFDCCTQLDYVRLRNCDAGSNAVWKINAPNSKLRHLELSLCSFGRLELVCIPKLEDVHWDIWFCHYAPLSFGFVPSLRELCLACGAQLDFEGFRLSEVLQGTKDLHTLTLDFQGEKLWIQPEQKQFCPAFNNLNKLSILCVYVEFDLLWAINLLEAAPSVEFLFIDTWEHVCLVDQMDEERRKYIYGERTHPSWEISEFTGTRKWQLKKLQFAGFRPLKQQLVFLKAIMEQARNLKAIILKEDERCEDCEAIGTPLPYITDYDFPKTKDEQNKIVEYLRDKISSPPQIIFL